MKTKPKDWTVGATGVPAGPVYPHPTVDAAYFTAQMIAQEQRLGAFIRARCVFYFALGGFVGASATALAVILARSL